MTKDGADNLLARWGAWSRHSLGTGYAKENIINRMIREGGGAGHNAGAQAIPMAKDIETVESLINKMSKTIKKTVKIKYIARIPDCQAAKRCRCSEDEFARRINFAIDVVAVEID